MTKSKNNVNYKPVTVTLGDETYPLSYSMNSICAIEEHFLSFQECVELMQQEKFVAIRTMVWAGLIDVDDKDGEPLFPSLRQFSKMVNFTNLQEVIGAVMQAVSNDMPQDEEEDPKN